MPPSASLQGRIPTATRATAPASAQTASGRRKGRTITPAVAGMMMPQASMVSCEIVSTLLPDPSRYSAAIAEVGRAVFPMSAAADTGPVRVSGSARRQTTTPTAATPPSIRNAAL